MENPQLLLLEQYLDGALPPEERKAFEAQLATDPELARELRLHEAARAALTLQGVIDHRTRFYQRGRQMLFWKKWQWKIQDAFGQIFAPMNSEGNSQPRWGLIGGLALATALLILFIAQPGLFFPDTPGTPSFQIIPKEQAIAAYQTHFKRYDLNSTLGNGDTDTLFQNAQAAYTAGNCNAALEALAPLLNDASFERRPLALLLQGTCLLDLGKAPAAIETLQQIPPAAARLHEEAQWYIALAYLAQSENEEASEILKQIAEATRHRHYQEAREMLKMVY